MIYPTVAELHIPRNLGKTPADRLLAGYSVEPNGCWRWTRALTTVGYGHMSIKSVYFQAHRLMYILKVGPIPEGVEPDHLCRNRWCVNPSHLELVTRAENTRRGLTARLTAAQVAAIRQARSEGGGVRALARQYGVSPATVSRIVNGLRWAEPTAA